MTWGSPARHFYMLRMCTPGLSQSRLNRSMGSALILHTVHSKTWGGSRSTSPHTTSMLSAWQAALQDAPLCFLSIHSSLSLLLPLPPTPALAASLLLRGLFSSCSKQGLLSGCCVQACLCGGFSCLGAWAPGYLDFSSCGFWA